MTHTAMVVTTINAPTRPMLDLASRSEDWPLIVVGDAKTPNDWNADGARFFPIQDQLESRYELAGLLPQNHYCRKNLGYLEAMSRGATVIAETDDDNYPGGWPHKAPDVFVEAPLLSVNGWANVYHYFTEAVIWPRGLPLTEIRKSLPAWDELSVARKPVAVHQYLAAGDPDVDAIYRLTIGRDDHSFIDRSLIVDYGTVVPFNSQSTIWLQEAFPLLYLPSFVSFRMTDIWRSFVAQICLWAAGLHVAYHGQGVYQERNAHDLHRDFLQEVVGYERNQEILDVLRALELTSGVVAMGDNLRKCYRALRSIGIVDDDELQLVEAWLRDVATLRNRGDQ